MDIFKTFLQFLMQGASILLFFYIYIVLFMMNFQTNERNYINQLSNGGYKTQDCSNSIANALELLQSCAKPWK